MTQGFDPKTLVLGLVLLILISSIIYVLTKKPAGLQGILTSSQNEVKGVSKETPSPSPTGFYQEKTEVKPIGPKIDANTDLKATLDQMEIPMFTEDFKTLRSEVNSF